MTDRHPFGGQISDWVFVKNDDDIPVFSGGALLQFWNARDGGTQYTDLAADADGATPITALLSSDGTDGYELGDIPVFYGPPFQTFMWVSADGGVRHAIGSLDTADLAGQAIQQLNLHVAQQNAHGTTVDTLHDFSPPGTKVDGSFLAWDEINNRYTLVTAAGLNPSTVVQTAGGSTIRIPNGDITTAAQVIRVPAGTRSSAPDTFSVYWNSGTDGSPVWAQIFWLDSYGQPRVQASADSRVASKVLRHSSGATADMQQWCSEAGTPLAWVKADGSLRSPSVGRSVSFTKAGAVTAGQGKFVYTNMTGVSQTLRASLFRMDTANTSGTMVCDIMLNGTSLYPSGKPSLGSGVATTGIITSAFTIPAAGVVRVDVTGTFSGGSDMTGQLEFV